MISSNILFRSIICKYFTFKGRATRKEYGYNSAFIHLYFVLLFFLDKIYGDSLITVCYASIGLCFFIPFISLSVRRLHDINKSGWWLFFAGFIPFIGNFVVLILLFFIKGTPGTNKYGEPPV